MKTVYTILLLAAGLFFSVDVWAQDPPKKKSQKKKEQSETPIAIDEPGQPGTTDKDKAKPKQDAPKEKKDKSPAPAQKTQDSPAPPAPPIAVDEPGQPNEKGKSGDVKPKSDSMPRPSQGVERPKDE